jgi:hypothetical protein
MTAPHQPVVHVRVLGLVAAVIVVGVFLVAGLVIAAAVHSAPAAALLPAPATPAGKWVLPPEQVKDNIIRVMQAETGYTPTDVRCPPEIDVAVGSTFVCSGVVAGQAWRFEFTQKDDEGNTMMHAEVARRGW